MGIESVYKLADGQILKIFDQQMSRARAALFRHVRQPLGIEALTRVPMAGTGLVRVCALLFCLLGRTQCRARHDRLIYGDVIKDAFQPVPPCFGSQARRLAFVPPCSGSHLVARILSAFVLWVSGISICGRAELCLALEGGNWFCEPRAVNYMHQQGFPSSVKHVATQGCVGARSDVNPHENRRLRRIYLDGHFKTFS